MKQIRYLGTLLACLMLFTSISTGAELTKRELTIENRAEVDAYCAYAYLLDDEDVRNTKVLPGFHVKGWIYVPSGRAVTIEYASNYGFVYVCIITADGNQAQDPVSPLSFSVSKDMMEGSFKVIHEVKSRAIGDILYTSANVTDLETKVFSRKNYSTKGWQLTTGIPGPVEIKAEDLSRPQSEVPSNSFDGVYDAQEFVRHGKDYALLFATDTYRDPYWNDFGTRISDAEAIAVELFLKYGFTVDLQRNVTIRDISKALAEYAEKSYLPGDQLLVYFAGHGVFHEALKEGYIASTDSISPDTPGYQHSYLSHSELKSNLDKLGCERVLLVLDVDYGGTFDDEIALRKNLPTKDNASTKVDPTERRNPRRLDLGETLKVKTRWYLSAGGKETVREGLGEHSPFAASLLTVLKNGAGKDGVLTIPEIEHQLPSKLQAELDKAEAAWREKYPLWEVKMQQTPASGPFGCGKKSDKAFVFIKSQK